MDRWELMGAGLGAAGSVPGRRGPGVDPGVNLQALPARLAQLWSVLCPKTFLSVLSGDETATVGRSRGEKTKGGGTTPMFAFSCSRIWLLWCFICFIRVSNGLQGILEGILRSLPKRRMPYFVDSKKKNPCARTPTHRVRMSNFVIVL